MGRVGVKGNHLTAAVTVEDDFFADAEVMADEGVFGEARGGLKVQIDVGAEAALVDGDPTI